MTKINYNEYKEKNNGKLYKKLLALDSIKPDDKLHLINIEEYTKQNKQGAVWELEILLNDSIKCYWRVSASIFDQIITHNQKHETDTFYVQKDKKIRIGKSYCWKLKITTDQQEEIEQSFEENKIIKDEKRGIIVDEENDPSEDNSEDNELIKDIKKSLKKLNSEIDYTSRNLSPIANKLYNRNVDSDELYGIFKFLIDNYDLSLFHKLSNHIKHRWHEGDKHKHEWVLLKYNPTHRKILGENS